jgi:hypothetical protein
MGVIARNENVWHDMTSFVFALTAYFIIHIPLLHLLHAAAFGIRIPLHKKKTLNIEKPRKGALVAALRNIVARVQNSGRATVN